MKTIQRPEPIGLMIKKVPATKEDGSQVTISFEEFIRFIVDGDERFNNGGRGIRSGMNVLAALDAEGDLVLKRPEDYELLKLVLEQPTCGLPKMRLVDGSDVHLGRQLLPFLEAVGQATDVKD